MVRGLMKTMKQKNDAVIMGFDTSSKSIAYCAIERGRECRLLGVGMIHFPKASDDHKRFIIINEIVPWVMNEFHPDIVAIEQPIYISNFKVSRTLSYVVGHLHGEIARNRGIVVEQVPPLTWKANLKVKNVTKSDKQIWAKTMSAAEVKKKAAFERKDRTRQKVKEMIPELQGYEDDNIFDAVGVAIWAAQTIN